MKKYYILIALIASAAFSVQAQTRSTKRGIAYGHHAIEDIAKISTGVSWWYNWYYKPEDAVATVYQNYNMDFVPMAWGRNFDEAGLRTFYAAHPTAKYLLAFNEPNFTTQANMTPAEVASLWPKLEKIAADYGLKIVGPAVNYCDQCITVDGVKITDPVTYLDAFFTACPNCKVDYIAVHNYMCYSGALADYINRFKKYNRPIWLTEFACWDQANITLDMQKSLVLGALDYLESEPMVFRYAWFTGNRSGSYPYLDLFGVTSGQLTILGELYLNYNPVHDPNAYVRIPARIEAENYAAMSGVALEATKDIDGIANVGWIDANDWLEYNIDVPVTGNYVINFRIASNATTSLQLRENSTILVSLAIPSSGGWQNWSTFQTNIAFTAGKHKLRLFTPTGQFNINWISFSDVLQSANSINILNFRLYPNPVTDVLHLEFEPNISPTNIDIIDTSGKILVTQTINANTINMNVDFSIFAHGCYVVRIKNATSTINKLVIK